VARALTEAELLARAQSGDEDAYAALVRAHQELAFRTAVLITQDAAEAEEAAQDAFLKAWRALGRFRRDAPFRPWLLAIVANEARNRRRAAGRRTALSLRLPRGGERAPSAEAVAVAAGERTDLLGALGRLRVDDRLVLGCRYLLELSEAETAAALGVRVGTVKSRTARALGRLRGEVGDAA
jgi:RNA polymerase sigma factor (sigma-70 family)